jgi:two-component system response regulator BaeR
MPNHSILVVEDDPKIARLLKDYLARDGFNATVLGRGDTVVQEVRTHPPDLILLDIMLPGKDGLTLCREIRGFSSVPILMLTAKVEEIDRLLGLELGADDYICKPFSPREVVARVKAVLRRTHPESTAETLAAGPIVIDISGHRATVNDSDLKLTPNEFALLRVLMARPGRVYSRSDLVSRIQGYNFEGYDRTIDSHIKNLRKKVSEHLPRQNIIRTIYGVGYAFEPPNPAAPD